jgi:polysaccharide biosynthesis protein VpsJ
MAAIAASVGEKSHTCEGDSGARSQIFGSLRRLAAWLEANGYEGYDTFDGLNARFARPLTFETKALRTLLQQGVRRFPINLRPLLGVEKCRSTKGMGFLARGFISLFRATGDVAWQVKAESMLQWLVESRSPGYSGACWGNHFDYQSRSIYVSKLTPSVVWTSLIGHAFLDAYEVLGTKSYLDIAVSSCEHIDRDLGVYQEGDTCCINYFPISTHQVHNANTLGASLLARTYFHTRNDSYRSIAEKAIRYTAKHQRANSSWYYGEEANLRWIDNFHTAYVLDCFKHYGERTGDLRFDNQMMNGYWYWKSTFFLSDGTPRYYDHKTLPLDIQCASQAIDTLVFFRDRDPESLLLAVKVAQWTIDNMQDPNGYFYYRRYSSRIVNKTPTLHWGQATMLCALAGLYEALGSRQLASGTVSESDARGLTHETY